MGRPPVWVASRPAQANASAAQRPTAQTTAPAVWFAYSEDRKGEHPRQLLKKFSGALQADAYSGL